MLIQLLRSEPLEPRLENGKRLHYNFKLNKIAARWPAKAVAQFFYNLIKSSGNQVLQVVLLSHHNQQSNRIDIPTAYDKNTIELPFWQAVLLC